MVDGAESAARVQSVMSVLHSLDDKIDNSYGDLVNKYLCYLSDTEISEKELLVLISQKLKRGEFQTCWLCFPRKLKTIILVWSQPLLQYFLKEKNKPI